MTKTMLQMDCCCALPREKWYYSIYPESNSSKVMFYQAVAAILTAILAAILDVRDSLRIGQIVDF